MKGSRRFVTLFLLLSVGWSPLSSRSDPLQDEAISLEVRTLIIQMHDDAREDFGAYCQVCHAASESAPLLVRKWKQGDGYALELAANHHAPHAASPVMDMAGACTYCHRQFELGVQPAAVAVFGYVDKTLCASCHSRFAPRELMDPSLQEISKNPPPGDETCTCACCHFAWPVVHTLSDVGARFVLNLRIGGRAEDCLACHGENPYLLPREVQDEYWQDKESIGFEYTSDRLFRLRVENMCLERLTKPA